MEETPYAPNPTIYKLGDKAYCIVGSYLIVPCTITSIDINHQASNTEGDPISVWSCCDELHPEGLHWDSGSKEFKPGALDLPIASIFYGVDEPIGHSIAPGDELFRTLEGAMEHVAPMKKSWNKYRMLMNWRSKSRAFTMATHRNKYSYSMKEYHSLIRKYPTKLNYKRVYCKYQ